MKATIEAAKTKKSMYTMVNGRSFLLNNNPCFGLPCQMMVSFRLILCSVSILFIHISKSI
ncbi:hypothetical protein GMSM_46480 [Geomonas sp. Red276]